MNDQEIPFDTLMEAICCIMCADGKVKRLERLAVHTILEREKVPWSHEEIETRINAFIERVKVNGLQRIIQDTCGKVSAFREIGKENVIQRCIDYMVCADGNIDKREIETSRRLKAALSSGTSVSSDPLSTTSETSKMGDSSPEQVNHPSTPRSTQMAGDMYSQIEYLASKDYSPFKHPDGKEKTPAEIVADLDDLEASQLSLRARGMKIPGGKSVIRRMLEPYFSSSNRVVVERAQTVWKRLHPWWRFW